MLKIHWREFSHIGVWRESSLPTNRVRIALSLCQQKALYMLAIERDSSIRGTIHTAFCASQRPGPINSSSLCSDQPTRPSLLYYTRAALNKFPVLYAHVLRPIEIGFIIDLAQSKKLCLLCNQMQIPQTQPISYIAGFFVLVRNR